MAAPPLTSLLSFVILSQLAVYSRGYPKCHQSKCGTLPLIQFPFSYNTTNPRCGLYNIKYEGNNQIPMIKLEERGIPYVLKAISYESTQLTIQDERLVRSNRSQICNDLHNFTVPPSPFLVFRLYSENFTFLRCKRGHETVFGDTAMLYNYTDCTDHVLYYIESRRLPAPKHNCSAFQYPVSTWLMDPYRSKQQDLWTLLAPGFGLVWQLTNECEVCHTKKRGFCSRNETTGQFICFGKQDDDDRPNLAGDDDRPNLRKKIIIGVGLGVLFLLSFPFLYLYCYARSAPPYTPSSFQWCFKKRTTKAHNVEGFLQSYGSHAPKRYCYSNIKKTDSFKDKLGQGGYGGVFKGNINDGRVVAVKVLNDAKGNGEEFINEVATIGRTYHINIVRLLGFCSEGSKRALVYEFMPKGSLEKFIFSQSASTKHALGFENLFQIAIGIARGVEYLHRGCSTRILHFDIKPHNILLDNNFCLKISDFGLAKICPGQESIISMTNARGTMGYIAPEVFCRNIGGVSHKSDVYSYGMMILEMVGGRKNIDALVENTSEVYFPHWVYNCIIQKENLEIFEISTATEETIVQKMILVGLWCIQTDPANRPSISKVVEMLEGSLEDLQMPPKPYLSSPSRTT